MATGIPGIALFRESDLWGVDPSSGATHLFAITNSGDVHDHSGTYADGVFTLAYDTTVDGAAFHEDVVVTISDRAVTLVNVILVEGTEVARLEGTARR